MSNTLQPVRGTHDFLPEDSRKYRFVSDTMHDVAERYGYGEIRTPVFEFSEVFHRTLGDTSDVVTKETYSFTDRGGENITLRPEFTAPVARAFMSHGLKDQLPLKFFYEGPAFRYERPQKGRMRQFHQVGVELLGVAEPLGDVEVIALAWQFLQQIGVGDKVRLELNSLGDSESRQRYREALVKYFTSHKNALSTDSQTRLERNPLRILDSKDEGDRRITQNAPRMNECFTEEAKAFFIQVKNGLDALDIAYTLNERLVRGLDYYTHTVFEFTTEALGAQNTVLAGGRYDHLVEIMGGPDTPGVGWAAGIERLCELIDFAKHAAAITPRRPIVTVPLGEEAEKALLKLADSLRRDGFYVEATYRGNVKKRMQRADKLKAACVLMMGDNELAKNVVTLRNLDSGAQEEVALNNLHQALKPYR